MDFTKNYIAENDLLKFINQQYAIKGEKIRLYRASQGRIFFIKCSSGRKVFKLYMPTWTEYAIQTTRIIPYLDGCGYPVVHIIPAVSGEMYVTVDRPEGSCVGVLFEYAHGKNTELWNWGEYDKPLVISPLMRQFSRQVAVMHRLMDNYKKPLIYRGRQQYFDDMIYFMRRDNYDEAKTRDFEEYGNELWRMMEKCTLGFCHDDMHSGNTKYRDGKFIWMDFDRASLSYPIIDLSWMSNNANFVVFDERALETSRRLFDEAYAGYSMERTLTNNDIAAVFHFIAIEHLDANDMIIKNYGINKEFMDGQHDWLMRWREACNRLL